MNKIIKSLLSLVAAFALMGLSTAAHAAITVTPEGDFGHTTGQNGGVILDDDGNYYTAFEVEVDDTTGSVNLTISWDTELAEDGQITVNITNTSGDTGTAVLTSQNISFHDDGDTRHYTGYYRLDFTPDADGSTFDVSLSTDVAEVVVGGIGVSSVPEPGTMVLLGTGLAGLVGAGRRRREKRKAAAA